MEVNTQRRAAGLNEKIPDIQKTLDTVRFLKTRKVCADNFVQAKAHNARSPNRSRWRPCSN